MTLEVCAAFCDGFTYFGTEYGRECKLSQPPGSNLWPMLLVHLSNLLSYSGYCRKHHRCYQHFGTPQRLLLHLRRQPFRVLRRW